MNQKFNDICDKVYDDICKTWDRSKRPVSIYALKMEHGISEKLLDDIVYQLTSRRATVRYSSGGLKPEYAYIKAVGAPQVQDSRMEIEKEGSD